MGKRSSSWTLTSGLTFGGGSGEGIASKRTPWHLSCPIFARVVLLLQTLIQAQQIGAWQLVVGWRQGRCPLERGTRLRIRLRFHQRPTQVVQVNGTGRFQCHGPPCGTDCLCLPPQSPANAAVAMHMSSSASVLVWSNSNVSPARST